LVVAAHHEAAAEGEDDEWVVGARGGAVDLELGTGAVAEGDVVPSFGHACGWGSHGF